MKRLTMVATLGATVLLSASPKERPILAAIFRHMKHAAVDLSRAGLTLGALKEVVRRCDLMVTNDTGPRHIAAAFDVPVVTIFGPTHPEWTEIYFAKERKVAVKVFCGPCQKKTCPLDHRCMTHVTPRMVFDTAATLLNKALQEHVAGDLAAASEHYEAVIARDPQNKFAYYNLGLIAQTSGRSPDAEHNYRPKIF